MGGRVGVSGSLAGPVEDQRVGGGAQSGLGTDRDHVEGTPRCVFGGQGVTVSIE